MAQQPGLVRGLKSEKEGCDAASSSHTQPNSDNLATSLLTMGKNKKKTDKEELPAAEVSAPAPAPAPAMQDGTKKLGGMGGGEFLCPKI